MFMTSLKPVDFKTSVVVEQLGRSVHFFWNAILSDPPSKNRKAFLSFLLVLNRIAILSSSPNLLKTFQYTVLRQP